MNTRIILGCLSLCVVFSLSLTAVAGEEDARLVLFTFAADADISAWEVEDDVVMGGRSDGHLALNEAGHGVFSGTVSLDNDGGFSSIQYYFDPIDVSAYSAVHIRLKGDGKRYLFLVEAEPDAYHYYVGAFQTTGDWETVSVPFSEMEPVRRGDRLDLPNFPGETLAQVRIMIANQTRETFAVEIAEIWLE